MCYEIVFCDTVCLNDHPVKVRGITRLRMCRAHAEDCSKSLRKWDTLCKRDVPPSCIWERTTPANLQTDTSQCPACRELESDLEMTQSKSEEEQVKHEIEGKRSEIAKHRKVVAEVELRDRLANDKRHREWNAIGRPLEDRIDVLSAEIRSLLAGKAKTTCERLYERQREIEEKYEDEMIEAARDKADSQGINYYYGPTTEKERSCYPDDFPKHFLPSANINATAENLNDSLSRHASSRSPYVRHPNRKDRG